MKKINLNEKINESKLTELSNSVMEEIDGGCHYTYFYKNMIQSGQNVANCSLTIKGYGCIGVTTSHVYQ